MNMYLRTQLLNCTTYTSIRS